MYTHPALEPVVAWLTSIMVSAAPPAYHAPGRTYPEAVETVEEATERYRGFAEVIAKVAYDPSEKPVYGGADARSKTALTMLSVAYWESGLRKDVATGVGKHSRGDHGRSCTPWQFNIGTGKNLSGHTCEELLADPEQAARDGLQVIRIAMTTCKDLPVSERLSLYLTGKCEPGNSKALLRFNTAVKWMSHRPAAINEKAIVAALEPTDW